MTSSLSIFSFMNHTCGVKCKNSCLALGPEDFLLCFVFVLFFNFIALCFTFKPGAHFELILDIEFILLPVDVPSHCLLKRPSFLH